MLSNEIKSRIKGSGPANKVVPSVGIAGGSHSQLARLRDFLQCVSETTARMEKWSDCSRAGVCIMSVTKAYKVTNPRLTWGPRCIHTESRLCAGLTNSRRERGQTGAVGKGLKSEGGGLGGDGETGKRISEIPKGKSRWRHQRGQFQGRIQYRQNPVHTLFSDTLLPSSCRTVGKSNERVICT